ncbi:adenylate/guanylate cyclase domain-containing protein [Constantimarinum furrinae]|uniref:Adenylate/guanylate cyclase n=1 Tax=Constantimarinum furrinae TaxID=2562285 RepID=A0A7G8PVT4_9FLAO|nr:adenylate/guanylate cyclase domain-containing protein [Constantimarinum furrinae]QNJ98450.1 Putative adenylate/guanylate cyclase [Constantimarinum furrinae]
MKKPRFRRYTNRQLWFYARRAFWVLFSYVLIANALFFYEYFTLVSNGVLSSTFDFKQAFTANLIVGVSAGLIGGLITVNLMEKWLRVYPFGRALLFITITYIAAALMVSTIGALYYYSEKLGMPFYSDPVLFDVYQFFGTWLFLKNFIVWLFVVVVTLIIFMVNDKYGPGVFPDYLMGRYFMPKHERRIFMFADIKNATGIAETLGEEKYFNFLKDFFRDIAPAIVQTRGEVYQYVGDEIVVSWKMKHGLKNGNAVQCYYSMKKIIKYKKRRYIRKYDTYPEFKVGFHFGSVMVGEIGQIKRDIAFSGDVLNTTSRIQAMCNELNVEILASQKFADIAYKLPKGVTRHDMGDELLKGKKEEIGLVTFRNKN